METVMGGRFNVLAPDLLESAAALRWTGDAPFRLTDEARTIVDTIDATDGPIHLVGHSYGGRIASRIAIERPHRVASLSPYKPTVFHVLNAMGEDGRRLLGEIRAWGLEIGRCGRAGHIGRPRNFSMNTGMARVRFEERQCSSQFHLESKRRSILLKPVRGPLEFQPTYVPLEYCRIRMIGKQNLCWRT
jgi:Alpha/beta hydrolase family